MQDLCPVNPFRDAPPRKDKGDRLDILTPEEMGKLLAADVPKWFKAWVVGGGFAGLRTAEMQRLSYSSIDTDYKEIVVRKDQSKQGEASRPRSITLQDAFTRHMPTGEGPWLSGKHPSDFSVEMPKALAALGWKKWKKNCLRHSFASYHLAYFRDAVKTAYELGHTSPTLLYSTYGNAVSRKDAEAWWKLGLALTEEAGK